MTGQRVSRGEHVSLIAEQSGFGRFETIFEAPENAEIRALRANPHQLVPGDFLAFPEKTPRAVEVPVDTANKVIVRRERLFLRARVLDFFGEPLRNENGRLVLESSELPVATDGDGMLQAEVPRTTQKAALTIAGMTMKLEVGALQPQTEFEGVRARLTNLGLWSGQRQVEDVGTEAEFSLGIELFQEEAGLPVDGQLNDATLSKLVEIHGQ